MSSRASFRAASSLMRQSGGWSRHSAESGSRAARSCSDLMLYWRVYGSPNMAEARWRADSSRRPPWPRSSALSLVSMPSSLVSTPPSLVSTPPSLVSTPPSLTPMASSCAAMLAREGCGSLWALARTWRLLHTTPRGAKDRASSIASVLSQCCSQRERERERERERLQRSSQPANCRPTTHRYPDSVLSCCGSAQAGSWTSSSIEH